MEEEQANNQPLFSQQMGEEKNPEEMQAAINDLMEKIEDKIRILDTKKIVRNNKDEYSRIEALKEVLVSMESAGVDLNDQNSINDFMSRLEEESPDIYTMFTEAMENLLGQNSGQEDSQAMGQPAMSPEDLNGLTSTVGQQSTPPIGPGNLGNLSSMMSQ